MTASVPRLLVPYSILNAIVHWDLRGAGRPVANNAITVVTRAHPNDSATAESKNGAVTGSASALGVLF